MICTFSHATSLGSTKVGDGPEVSLKDVAMRISITKFIFESSKHWDKTYVLPVFETLIEQKGKFTPQVSHLMTSTVLGEMSCQLQDLHSTVSSAVCCFYGQNFYTHPHPSIY